MGAQDKTEKVLRALHVLLSKSEPYPKEPGKVVIDKQEMLDLLVEFIKTDPRGAEYRDLDWSHEYALARAGGDGGQSAL